MAKFAINAMLLPNLIQVTESISGSVVPLAMFIALSRDTLLAHMSHMVRWPYAKNIWTSEVSLERAIKM